MPKTESGTGLLAPRPPEVFRYGQALGPSADAVRLSSGRLIVIESVRLPCYAADEFLGPITPRLS
jgi:hypothetical protein